MNISDVIGSPESWANLMDGDGQGILNMQGAVIAEVIAAGDQIAIETRGANSERTFSIFRVEDPDLRARTVRALRQGVEVHAAVAVEI